MNANNTTKDGFEDAKVSIKIRLSSLWASVTFCYLAGDYFELYVPQKAQGLMNGENLLNSPTKLFLASVLLAIPAVMVFLSTILRPPISRRLNIIIGVFFTIIMVLIALGSITPWRAFYVFFAILESFITCIIVVLAWKWPKQ